MIVLDPLNAPWNPIVLTLLCVGFPALVASIAYLLRRYQMNVGASSVHPESLPMIGGGKG
jgi:hypothetical protein